MAKNNECGVARLEEKRKTTYTREVDVVRADIQRIAVKEQNIKGRVRWRQKKNV